MAGQTVEARQRLSAALFNNSYYADVVLAIAAIARTSEHFVTTRKIAAKTRIGDSLVRPVVLRLEAGELLDRLPRMGGRRSEQNYKRSTSAQWVALVKLCQTLGANTEPVTRARGPISNDQAE